MKKKIDIALVIIAYNRPSHLKRLIISLEDYKIKNAFIFIDGAKNENDKILQKEIMTMVKGSKIKFSIFKKEKNLGIEKSINSALDKISKISKKIIVLEDDCIPRKNFFKFMKYSFKLVEKNNEISGVCGYQFPEISNNEKKLKIGIFDNFIPWGWGILSKNWNSYKKFRIKKDNNHSHAVKSSIYKKIINIIKFKKPLWTPNFILYNYLNKKKFLYPSISLIKNIGFDGSGINSKVTDIFYTNYTKVKNSKFIIHKFNSSLNRKHEKILLKTLKYFY